MAAVRLLKSKELRRQVEEALEKYRLYVLTFPIEQTPKITASYSLVPPTNTNQFHSSTEDAAINKVDRDRERYAYIEMIQKAVNRLDPLEREMIIRKYFGDEELFDYEVYNELGMGETFYNQKFKPRVFYKLAVILGIVDVSQAV
ncbi:ArpU family transcriptional regulator [Bacillus sp. AFS015802]|uniref:ArpU family phage packaging/lysis transcriptional regulator n=1 Tax=Bacillus sp. AFS015802 TaxID=2033486 RepID=UPI000BF3E9F9|nr:ArpU family phage packaging/lysis transcriptional regulator [Bacillus sp. AFS015802]PFA66852.1 ArpU family transcriptional regulator [Bacillus sp. AFS015802]